MTNFARCTKDGNKTCADCLAAPPEAPPLPIPPSSIPASRFLLGLRLRSLCVTLTWYLVKSEKPVLHCWALSGKLLRQRQKFSSSSLASLLYFFVCFTNEQQQNGKRVTSGRKGGRGELNSKQNVSSKCNASSSNLCKVRQFVWRVGGPIYGAQLWETAGGRLMGRAALPAEHSKWIIISMELRRVSRTN